MGAGLALAFACGLGVGGSTREGDRPRPRGPVEPRATIGAPLRPAPARPRALVAPPAPGVARAHEAPAATAAPAPFDLQASLEVARAAHAADIGDEAAASQAYDEAARLIDRLRGDAAARAATLQAFARATDPAELEFLGVVLGQVDDPDVEALALELALRGASSALRAAAFDVLDGLDTPRARAPVLEALRAERDPDVRLAALRALPEPAAPTHAEAGEVVEALRQVLGDSGEDGEARRRAVVSLGRWRRDDGDLQPVVQALAGDPDPAVRAGAAFALEGSGTHDPAVVGALVAALRDPAEDPLVRENAWHAIGRLGPHSPEVAAVHREHEAAVRALAAPEPEEAPAGAR